MSRSSTARCATVGHRSAPARVRSRTCCSQAMEDMDMDMNRLLCWTSLAILESGHTGCIEDDAAMPEVDRSQQAVATSAFTATYTGQGANATTCNTAFTITGQEPAVPGTFPVFLYMIGTGEP